MNKELSQILRTIPDRRKRLKAHGLIEAEIKNAKAVKTTAPTTKAPAKKKAAAKKPS